MKITYKLIIIFILALLCWSCSTAPKKQDGSNARKNKAADMLVFGNNYFIQGQYTQALIFFAVALDEYTAADYKIGIIKSMNLIGKTEFLLGDTAAASKKIKEAYQLSKTVGDKDLSALSALNMADISNAEGKQQETEKYLSEAATFAEPNSLIRAEIYHSAAIAEKEKGNIENAIFAIDEAIKINKKLKIHLNLAANYYFIASIYSKKGDYIKAIENLQFAIVEDRIEENAFGLGKDYKGLGIVQEKNSNLEDAYTAFVTSLRIFTVLDNKEEINSLLGYIIKLAEKLNKAEDIKYYKALLAEIAK